VALIINSILLGIALAMDAFSVSLANGLNEPCMKKRKMCLIAGMFGFFQALMPLIGWFCIRTVVQYFRFFEKLIPWIALGLLGYIGGKMLYDGIKNRCGDTHGCPCLCFGTLMVQAIATSIDALSAGFSIAHYSALQAVASAVIIALVTFVICLAGIVIGRKAGTCLCGKAGILGGVILIFIGLEIFIRSFI
jgi:putative Mn2+ efflux pump MntP